MRRRIKAKTGEIRWERWSGIDQKISTVCCGWLNRGPAMDEGICSSASSTLMWWR
jgi:hypothetical protein